MKRIAMICLIALGASITTAFKAIQWDGPVQTVQTEKWPKLKIHIDNGDWDDEKEMCVDGKGICRIRVHIIVGRAVEGEGNGELWYDGQHFHLVALAQEYHASTFQSNYSQQSFTIPRNLPLSDEVCDGLNIERGAFLPQGTYTIKNAGAEYAPGDREIVF